MKFGIMFFSSVADGTNKSKKYQLLIEAAKFADKHNFQSISTPERHFHNFGGLFPNPSVTSAALAVLTENIQIRASSLVAPLHNPIRMVEEWSIVDNLSQGRVGIAFGSGWNVNDFVFFPEHYAQRRTVMYEQIENIKRLWSGEPTKQINGSGKEVSVQIYPHPVQEMLPIWITSSGNVDTFVKAGSLGVNLLTHLEGQDTRLLEEKIQRYRNARAANGFDPYTGIVTLMQHTFLGNDIDLVKETVRGPMRDYLRSAINLEQRAASGGGTISGGYDVSAHEISERDMNDLLDIAFERYFYGSSILGTPDSCAAHIQLLEAIGVNEIACLIDFIDDYEATMTSLQYLNELRVKFAS